MTDTAGNRCGPERYLEETCFRVIGILALCLHGVTLGLITVSFATEYNLAQGIVLTYIGVLTFGMAIVATAVFVLIWAGGGARSGG